MHPYAIGAVVFALGLGAIWFHVLAFWTLFGGAILPERVQPWARWFMYDFHALGTLILFQAVIWELYLVAHNREAWMEWLVATLG